MHDIRTSHKSLRDVLGRPGTYMGHVSIHDVMCATPSLGPAAVKKILKQADVWPEDKLGKISQEDRERVIQLLPERIR